jgi:hypothetical protein
MPPEESEFLTRARRAQEQLVNQFINHPDVSLIDIGYAPGESQTDQDIVLRIHVRDRWMQASPEERVSFPSEIDGIPVVVIPGDYQLQTP